MINAERIKLTTVRSPLWAAVAAAALSFGLAALQAASVAYDHERLTARSPRSASRCSACPVLMIVAAMTVTGEYRSGLVGTTFMATPDPHAGVVRESRCRSCFLGVVAALMVAGSVLVARAAASAAVWRTAGAFALYARWRPCSVSESRRCCGTRQARSTILLLWPLLVEPLLGESARPRLADRPYLPFANVFRFLDVQWLFPGIS